MSAGHVTLGELEQLSLDDVQELLIFLEWQEEERSRINERERQKAAEQAKAKAAAARRR